MMDGDRGRGDRAHGGGTYASELARARAARAGGVSAGARAGGGDGDRDRAGGRGGGSNGAMMMRERDVRDGRGGGDADAAALRDRVEALKVRIDARYRASRRDGDAAESLFEPVSGASARVKELETERALARLITRANLEARAQGRRSGRLNDSAKKTLTEEEYDEIFSERSTEGSFHGYSTGKHARRSSFEDERIKFDSALPSVVDDDYCAEIGGRRNPTPGRTRDWLETTTPSSPERNSRRELDRDLETTSTLLKSPRRNGSFKMLSPEVARTMTADEALRPRVRRVLRQAETSSPDTHDSPKSPSERSFSRTSSTLSIASLCTSDRPSSAFSPVARRQEKKSSATTTLTTTMAAIQDDAPEQGNDSIAARARTTHKM